MVIKTAANIRTIMLRINKKAFGTIILTVASVLLTACNRNTIYSHFEHTDIDGWAKNDTLLYNIGYIYTGGVYDCNIGIRISNDYPFKSLTLIVRHTIWPSQENREDTICCKFIDDNGNISDKGLSLYQHKSELPAIRLNANDSITFSIRHYMRQEVIPGISDVGIEMKLRNEQSNQ